MPYSPPMGHRGNKLVTCATLLKAHHSTKLLPTVGLDCFILNSILGLLCDKPLDLYNTLFLSWRFKITWK
jgi:hypothetical protein